MSTQTRQYKQVTQGQRYQIEVFLGTDYMQKEIVVLVGISESALSRELSCNASDDGYGAEGAHALSSKRRVTATKFSEIDERHMPIIKKGLLLGWSPEYISFRMKVEVPDIALSHTTVYKRVASNKVLGGSLYKNLPRFGKRRCKGGKRKAGRITIPDFVDISDRLAVVYLWSRLGGWGR
ncbi:MAG: hypothetical protein QS721_04325 [Candidatus Endonucleobacter sp. (ex Gigantidas childressi)]|nr:hypothetical protein [Candidatus Endonucleobacter sp. (ex Gigantidas childressi)]